MCVFLLVLWTTIYISDNIVVLRRQYPRTTVYLWLTNTTRMTHLEADDGCFTAETCSPDVIDIS